MWSATVNLKSSLGSEMFELLFQVLSYSVCDRACPTGFLPVSPLSFHKVKFSQGCAAGRVDFYHKLHNSS